MTDAEELELMELEREHAAAKAQAAAPAAPAPEIPQWEAAARGLGQGATMGFADEAAGALGALRGKGYAASRDSYRAADKAARAAHPKTFGGTELAAGIGTTFIPGLGWIKGGKLLGNALRIGGAGGLQAFGNSESDTAGGLAADTALGVGLGLGGQAVGAGIAKAIPSASGTLKLARDQAIKHLRPTAKVAATLGKDRLDDIATELLDSGMIKAGHKAEDTLVNVERARNEVGKGIEEIVENSKGTAHIKDITDDIDKSVIAPLRGTSRNKALVQNLEERNAQLLSDYNNGTLTASQIEKEKRAINDYINYMQNSKPSQDAEMGIAKSFKKAGEAAIDDPKFLALKDKYGKLAEADLMTGRTAALAEGGTGLFGKMGDLTGAHLAIDALLHGNPAGVPIAVGRALTKGRINSTAAVGANKIAKILERNPWMNMAADAAETGVRKATPVAARSAWQLLGN